MKTRIPKQLFIVLLVVSTSQGCGRRRKAPQPSPPKISCSIPGHRTYYTEEGKTSLVVSWSEPTSSDGQVYRTSGLPPGSHFGEGDYTTVYIAQKDGLNSPPCVISFTVKVRTCHHPGHPDFGKATCEEPRIYGSYCTFTCDTGYKTEGDSRQKCGSGEIYIGQPFSCEIVTCANVTTPENTLPDCIDGYNYSSVCFFPCKEGYKKDGYYFATTCKANGYWSPPEASKCIDAVPPEIHNCPDSFIAYVGEDQQTAVVTYTPPTANDTVDGSVPVTLEEGPAPGASLTIDRDSPDPTVNLHTVRYTATDSGGLEALRSCVFTVSVAELTCPPLENQPKMYTECTEPVYVYGGSCDFSCFSGYPLEGSPTVKCEKYPDRDEAYWDWGESNETTKCTVQECPDPDPPLNGAIGCVPIASGKHCVLSCNENYDVPRTMGGDNAKVCDDAAGWLDGDTFPDCTEERRPNRYNLPAEFYFSGDCNSTETQNQIKEHVITVTLESDYKSQCERAEDCNTENVVVICGSESRRKRSVQAILVTFEFSVRYEFQPDVDLQEQLDKLTDQVYAMFDLFEQELTAGLMDSDELNLVADPSSLSAGYDDLVCELGLTPNYATLTCSACPTGTMFDEVIDDCIECPIGTYQDHDAQFSCIPCPEGFSTATTGSRNIAACEEMCPAGSVSNTGILPCYLCGIGTYQDEMGQKECLPCPEGTNSTIRGSNSPLNCKSDADLCAVNVCDIHGTCVPSLEVEDEYSCVCAEGYSGTDCSIPPDPCDNNACMSESVCVSNTDQYTCTCQAGFTGRFCELAIVDGGWGDYDGWSTCTKSCESGAQIRQRQCNNPRPQHGGLDCEGDNFEIRECATEACPICPPPWSPYRGEFKVTEYNDAKTAELICDLGTTLSDPDMSFFECNQTTGFQWTPALDERTYPKCTETALAKEANVRAEFQYQVPEVPQDVSVFSSKTEDLLRASPCVAEGTCSLNVAAELQHSSQTKREAEVTVVVYIDLYVTFDYEPYILDGEFQEDIANSTVADYAQLVTELENLFLQLQNATQDGSLPVNFNGQTYYPDGDSFIVDAFLTCPNGMQNIAGICVNCIPGYMGVNGTCEACDFGTYQDEEGQVTCKPCPEGQTTEYLGSSILDMCLVITATTTESTVKNGETVDSTSSSIDVASTESPPEGGNRNLVFLAIPALVLPLGLLVGVVVYCRYQHKKRKVNSQKVEHPEKSYTEGDKISYENLDTQSTSDVQMSFSAQPNTYCRMRPSTTNSIE